jgi:hypothetical protein
MKPLQLLVSAVVLGAAAVVLVAADRAAPPPQAEADIKALNEAGIDLTDGGLLGYLRGMQATPEVRREIKVLIFRLASSQFEEREDSSRRLAALAVLARADLEEARRSKDPEAARRARAILADLEAGAARREATLFASLREVHRRKTPGAVPLLLGAPPVWERPRLCEAAERALMAACRPADAEALRRALDSPDRHVRLAAAVTLLNRGDRRSLPVLGDLLDSPDLLVRHRASRLLRVVTGEEIGFAAYDAPAVRAKAAAEWRGWIQRRGLIAPLALPVPAETWLGKVLVVSAHPDGRLVELGEGGKTVWAAKYLWPWCCQGLPDGHRLVGSTLRSRVDEYDAEGRPVWGLDVASGAKAVQRLPGGNTLVALRGGAKMLEYRPDGTVGWEVSLPASPEDVRRLDGGNTLVTLSDSGTVAEVDRRGRVVWEAKGMKRPVSAQRIDNGNTLVSDFEGGGVVELDRDGRVVWSYPIAKPTHAERLPDGHTVISTSRRVFEIDPEGKVLWEQKVDEISHFSAF